MNDRRKLKKDRMEDMGNIISGEIISIPKIKSGSRIVTGSSYSLEIKVDKHFNWFQKKMIKWCFGFDVFDYKED